MKIEPRNVLQSALEAQERGQDVESILAGLPVEQAAEIRRLLSTAALSRLSRPSDVPAGAIQRSRARFLGAAAAQRQPAPGVAGGAKRVPRFALGSLAAVLALILGVGGLAEAAAHALPGEPLYSVKIAAEGVRLQLTADTAQRLRLEAIYAEQRAEDVRRLLELGRVVPVSFHGQVRSIGAILWDVEGIPVRRTPETRVIGDILPGMIIEVEGLTQPDGTVLADELRLEAYDALGTLEAYGPDQMTVGRVMLAITPLSYLEPGLSVGDRVLVRVTIDDGGLRRVVSAVLFAPPTPTPLAQATEPARPTATEAAATETRETAETEDHSGPGGGTPRPEATDEGSGSGDSDEDEEPEKLELKGVVQSIGSSWVVDGRSFRVDGGTEIKDNPGVGDTVKVVAFLQPDGSWWAEKIELED